METYVEHLKGQYGSLTNMFQTIASSKFATNIVQVNTDQTICEFDKGWSQFTKWTLQASWGRKRQVYGHHLPSSIQGEWLAINDQKMTF